MVSSTIINTIVMITSRKRDADLDLALSEVTPLGLLDHYVQGRLDAIGVYILILAANIREKDAANGQTKLPAQTHHEERSDCPQY